MKFVNQTFTEDLTIDYNEFVDCEIKDCVVMFHGGSFSLVRTKLTNVRFGCADAANNTLAFLRVVRATNPRAIDELLDQGGKQQAGPGKPTLN